MKKICFIVTPIGNDNSDIRRHIDGIIDACIKPVLNHYGYELVVAHRICEMGSINNQILEYIYNAELVIANLTGLNPNVMYELAFRHAIRKPVIIIMEKDTGSLPFDIISERTFFYVNDFQGVIELKKWLHNVIMSIESRKEKEKDVDNPIYTALSNVECGNNIFDLCNINKKDYKGGLAYIIDKINIIDSKLSIALSNDTMEEWEAKICVSTTDESIDKVATELKGIVNEVYDCDNIKNFCKVVVSYSMNKVDVRFNVGCDYCLYYDKIKSIMEQNEYIYQVGNLYFKDK